MVDANQQWDRATALRMGRALEEFNLVWIEEPLDAYDAEGHAQLARALDTPIATGEMLACVAEHMGLIDASGCDIIQPDAPRIGGITQFLRLAALADAARAAASPRTSPWRSTCTWPPPTRASRGWSTSTGSTRCSTSASKPATAGCSSRTVPGLGFTLSDQARAWTTESVEFGA